MNDLLDTGNRNTNENMPAALPNAVAVLVLGIISIVGCLFYGIPGLICGIIALFLHKKDRTLYQADPTKYEASYKNSRAGFTCAVIGVSLSGLFLLILVIGLLSIGMNGAFR